MQSGERGAHAVRLLPRCPPEHAANALLLAGFAWHDSEADVHAYLCNAYRDAAPVTTRLYTHSASGVSRGICLVEYAAVPHSVNNNNNSNSSNHHHHHHNNSNHHSNSASGGGGHASRHANAVATTTAAAAAAAAAALPPVSAVDLRRVQQCVHATPYAGRAIHAACAFLTSSRWDRQGQLPELPHDAPVLPLRRGRVGYGDAGYTVHCGAALLLPNTLTCDGDARLRALRKRLRNAAAAASATDATVTTSSTAASATAHATTADYDVGTARPSSPLQ